MNQWSRSQTLHYLDGIAIQMAVNWVGQTKWIPDAAAALLVAAVEEAMDTTDEFEPEARQLYRERFREASISDRFQSMTAVQARSRLDQIRHFRVERSFLDRISLTALGDPRVLQPLHGTALEAKYQLVAANGTLLRAELAETEKEVHPERSIQMNLRSGGRAEQDWSTQNSARTAMLRELRVYQPKVVAKTTAEKTAESVSAGICVNCGARNQFYRICRVCRRVQR